MPRPASTSFVLVGFGSLAGLLLILGVKMGFDADELKMGCVASLFILGPIILAAIGSTVNPIRQDKSFQLTPPEYMFGKRVKRRLWWLDTIGSTLSIAAFIAGCFGAMWCLDLFPQGSVVWFIIPFAAYSLSAVAFAMICLWLNWITRDEAKELLIPHRKWPESWLEPETNTTERVLSFPHLWVDEKITVRFESCSVFWRLNRLIRRVDIWSVFWRLNRLIGRVDTL